MEYRRGRIFGRIPSAKGGLTIGIQLRGPERSEGIVGWNIHVGGALLVEGVVGALACERLTELKLTAVRERVWGPTTRCVLVAQVCNADAPDHRRVAKDFWRAGEAVEESNSGAKRNRRDVDVQFRGETSLAKLCRRSLGLSRAPRWSGRPVRSRVSLGRICSRLKCQIHI